MKNKRWIIWVAAAILLIAGIWYYFHQKNEVQIQLETVKPTVGNISTNITATGTVQPVDTVAVGTQVSGIIKNIYVDFNSKVKKGQLLATLDPDLLRDQMLQMQSNLASAKSALAYNTTNFNRQAQLYKIGAISKADYDTALNSYQAAKAQVSAVNAQLAAANKNLSLTNIYAPIDGTILNRSVSAGQTVASSFSTPTLFSIAKDLTKMQVRASIDEADIGNVKEGQDVTFTVDAFPNDTFHGTVSEVRLHPTVSSNVVKYYTIIYTNNADEKLKPGMTANISVITNEQKNVMTLPAAALAFVPDSLVAAKYKIDSPYAKKGKKHSGGKSGSGGGSGYNSGANTDPNSGNVWVLGADNSISKKHVQTGLNNNTEVQIVSGLSANDNVITGYKKLGGGKSGKSGSASPFLPQRRGGGQKPGGQGGPPR